MADLSITDGVCERAITHIVTATDAMVQGNTARPTEGFESLTGIAAEVDLYLRGVQVARAALADAARTAGQSIRVLMQHANELDATLSSSLDAKFSVQGAKR